VFIDVPVGTIVTEYFPKSIEESVTMEEETLSQIEEAHFIPNDALAKEKEEKEEDEEEEEEKVEVVDQNQGFPPASHLPLPKTVILKHFLSVQRKASRMTIRRSSCGPSRSLNADISQPSAARTGRATRPRTRRFIFARTKMVIFAFLIFSFSF